MIKVSIIHEDNQMRAFEISGHAKSGPYGYDLVCAGVSAVSFGTVNAIYALCKIDLEVEQAENGYLYVALPPKIPKLIREKVDLLIEGMLISLQTIEREYSQFITVKTE